MKWILDLIPVEQKVINESTFGVDSKGVPNNGTPTVGEIIGEKSTLGVSTGDDSVLVDTVLGRGLDDGSLDSPRGRRLSYGAWV